MHRPDTARRLVLDRFVAADDDAKQRIARVIRHLEALDRTKAWALEGRSSLYDFCTEDRQWSLGQTAIRVQVALAGRRVPRVFDMLDTGELSVSSAAALAPMLGELDAGEAAALLDAARGLSKRAIGELLAERYPKPDVPDRVRKVPQPRPMGPTTGALALVPPGEAAPSPVAVRPACAVERSSTSTGRGRDAAPAPRERVQPLAADRFEVRVTVSRATRETLRAVQALMSHRKAAGLEAVLDEALGLLHDKLVKEKFGVGRARSGTRRPGLRPAASAELPDRASVPAAVRAEVYERDGGACTYVDPVSGRRCGERRWLQIDHIVPRCRGGKPTAGGLRLLCGPHNRLIARQILGDAFMDSKLGTR